MECSHILTAEDQRIGPIRMAIMRPINTFQLLHDADVLLKKLFEPLQYAQWCIVFPALHSKQVPQKYINTTVKSTEMIPEVSLIGPSRKDQHIASSTRLGQPVNLW